MQTARVSFCCANIDTVGVAVKQAAIAPSTINTSQLGLFGITSIAPKVITERRAVSAVIKELDK